MATVLGGEEWTGYEATMRQGLRELDDTTEVKRRGTYASKPLVSERGMKTRRPKQTCGLCASLHRLDRLGAIAAVSGVFFQQASLVEPRRCSPVFAVDGCLQVHTNRLLTPYCAAGLAAATAVDSVFWTPHECG